MHKEDFLYNVYLIKGTARFHSKTYGNESPALKRKEDLLRRYRYLGYIVEIEVTPRVAPPQAAPIPVE